MEQVLSTLGLARRAGRVEIGEEAVGKAARAKKARVILLAADAGSAVCRGAAGFAAAGGCPLLTLEAGKEEIGGALGFNSVAVAAVTDFGLAAAVAKKLAALNEETYGEAARFLQERAQRYERRRQKKCRRQEKPDGRPGKK